MLVTQTPTDRQKFRTEVLAAYGADFSQIKELLAYNQNVFDRSSFKLPQFPLASEPHLLIWEEYAVQTQKLGTFETLKQVLVQLNFPVREGIGQTEEYLAATRKGIALENISTATGLVLKQPEQLHLRIHQSLAGKIPVLTIANREDFVSVVQALTKRNEPQPIPASMGACIVSGYNNWERIRRYRQKWEAKNGDRHSELAWKAEFQKLIPQKKLYQDRFIILSDAPYSNVSADEIGLEETQWRRLSLIIRLEHECTHYLTRRLFGSMRNNLLDELIADYQGIVAANGRYRADWFLRFLGLEFSNYREGGRLQNYRGDPPLSDGAFRILQKLVTQAAENLERFDIQSGDELRTKHLQHLMLLALTDLTIEELASEQAISRLQQVIHELTNKL